MTIDKNSLASQIGGKVVIPEEAGYDELVKRWGGNAERRAAFIVLVKSPDDISKTIAWATENKLDLAIKGGGHSCSASSSSEGGVIIDLSALREVKVDTEKRLAYAQGGATWEDFDKATTAAGFAGVGGTVNHTGMGGLILGGGYGYLMGQYGLCIDNLVEVTIVVADGRIIKANANENEDIFWGIRGGGCNFGVVYEFVMKIYPHQGSCFGGMFFLTPDKIPGVVAAFEKFWRNPNPKTSFTVGIGALPPTFQPLLVCVPFYDTDDEKLARETFADFFALEPIADHTSIHPYVEQNTVLNPIAPHGPRTYLKGIAYSTLSTDLVQYALEKFTVLLSTLGDDYIPCAILFENYPTAKMNETASDGTAFANRGTHSNCFLLPRWKSASNDPWVATWVKDFVAGARAIDTLYADKLGRPNVSGKGYANTIMPDDKVQDAFRENLPRLKALKKKWDPNGRFNKWLAIPV